MSQTQKNKKTPVETSAPTEKKEVIKEIYQQEILQPRLKTPLISSKVFIFYLLMSVMAGFLAGFIQDFWFDDYQANFINPTEESKSLKEPLDLNFLLQQQDSTYTRALSQLKSQVVGFYKKKASEEILDSLYLEKDFLGSGIVVTSDGWVLTHQSVIKDNDYVIITANKKILEPLKEVMDLFSGTVLIQIAAEGLSPVKFADLNAIQATEPLLVARYSAQNHGSDIVKSSIQKFSYHDQSKGRDFLLSTEKIDHYLKLANGFDAVYNGAVLVNEKVEIVGLLFVSGRPEIRLATPGYYLDSAVSNFLKSSSEVIRSYLGVHYIDLSESLGLPEEVIEGRVKGAVLLGEAKEDILAVAKSSPAETAGLKAGDIILKVNNEEVDEKNSLTKLIQDYTPGQELTLTILRDKQTLEIKVVLGEL